MRGRAWMLTAICVLGAAGPSAQQPSFRAGTELIVVDVSVVGKDGAPVTGLQEADFTVTIDGRPRAVRSLKFVDDSVRAAAAEGGGGSRVSSNASESTGRLVLILVDESSIAFGGLRAAAESVERLLAGFGPADKVGLASLPGPRMLVDFTVDRARIADGLKRIPAGAGPGSSMVGVLVTPGEAFAMERGDTIVREQVVARECEGASGLALQTCVTDVSMEGRRLVIEERNRTGQFASGLRGVLDGLAAVDAPKLVIVFSEGFVDPEAASQLAACGPAATAARATIFAMRLDRSMFDASVGRRPLFSMTTQDERGWAIASLDALAGAARGTALEIIGSAEIPFTRLARELSGYYLVGVEAEARDRDGKFHPIKVEVKRPGVSVRARRELTARAPVKDEKKLLAQVMASPLSVPGIPLRVTTFNMAADDARLVRVLVVGEIDREPPGAPPALVGLTFTDAQGKTTGDLSQKMDLPPLDSGALSLMLATTLPPGDYTMKVGVARNGRAGTVEHRVSARLTETSAGAQPGLRMGDLLVAGASGGDRMAAAMRGRISGDRFVSFVQIAAGGPPQDLSFVFDVVKEESGPALLSAPGRVVPAAKGTTAVAEALLDSRLLPPGDYGVRLTVLSGGAKTAALFVPFSLERPAPSAPPAAVPAAPAARAAARPTPPADAVRFVRDEVLDPLVLAPFLEEVARLAPASSRPALELARGGRIEEAVKTLGPGTPGDPSLPFLRGLLLFSQGNLQPASNEFRAAIAEAQELFVGAFYLGACYAAGGKDSQAIGAWQTSLVGLGRYPAVYRFLGDALIRTGQADRAQKLLATAAGRWPDDPQLRARMVRATVEAGRYQQALDDADSLIASRPTDSSVLFLAMRSAFQALVEQADIPPALVLERLRRYRDLYAAAGGLQQALVEEWVKYAEKVSRQKTEDGG